MTFRVVALKSGIDFLRNPPDQKVFLSLEHFYNFSLMLRLIKEGTFKPGKGYYIEDSSKVHHYEYWVQALEYRDGKYLIIIGTDDSGKLFVQQANTGIESVKQSWGKVMTRQRLFGFSYHWFETFDLSNIFVRVRLQGDLVVSVAKATPDLISHYRATRVLHWNSVRWALRHKDPRLALADDPLVERLDIYTRKFLGVKLFDRDKLWLKESEYQDVYLKEGERFRIRWGRFPRYHVVEFRGARLDPRTFLVHGGRLKVSHEEHGTNVVDWGQDVIVSF